MGKGKKRSGGAKKAHKKQREAAAAAAAAAATATATASSATSAPSNGTPPVAAMTPAANGTKPAPPAAPNGLTRRANDFATAAPARPFSKAKQKAMVRLLMRQADKQGLQVGDKRFVIPAKWWERWCQYVDYDDELDDDVNELMNPAPSRLNNLPLLHVSNEDKLDELMGGPLRPQLKENYHYTLVPQEVWDAFVCWYNAGPAIARFVVQAGDPKLGNTFNRVQVYPEQSDSDPASEDEPERAPLAPNGSSARANGVEPKKAGAQRRASLVPASVSVPKVCGACRKATATLKRCGGCQMVWYCGAACQASHWKYHKAACRSALPDDEKEATILEGLEGERRGKMGLRNLGNTCFMNSALQCLSHTEVITRFFLSNEYLKDINKDNPLGTGGNLAKEYDSLLKELWFGTTPSMNPASFKRAVGRFAPQFSGFQQHDAQELLAYILDGLHEDLNRVKNKPYTEAKESDGSTDDAIVAKEAWERHLLRNDSIFVDHVQGQFKSTVVCPICAKVSITFDPFNCIQLELPIQQTRKMELIFVPINSVMTRYAVDVPKKGSVLDMKAALSQRCGVAPNRMVSADIYQSMTYRVVGDSERLARLRDEDRILVYEVDEPLPSSSVGPSVATHYGFLYHRIDANLVGDPLLFSFDVRTSCRALIEKWSAMLSMHVAQTSELTLTEEELAPCVFLADRDGSFLRKEPIPADEETLFLDYVRSNSDALTDGLAFVSLLWSPALRASPGAPRPDYERIVSDESVGQRSGRAGQGGITLDDCFRDFTKPETLDQANLWYCNKCKEHRQARKTMEIWKLPDVLVLSLKRFEYRNEILRDKLDAYVDFPLADLDMAPFCLQSAGDGELVYDLYAVSNHYGSMAFGHYTAFARSWQDGDGEKFPGWYSFDDSHVTPAMPAQVKTNAAYILFYKRRRMGGEAPAE